MDENQNPQPQPLSTPAPVAPEPAPVAPPTPPAPPAPEPVLVTPQSSQSTHKTGIAAVVILLLLIGGVFAYAYKANLGPFAVLSSHEQAHFISEIAAKSIEATSATSNVTVSFGVSARDADAKPFVGQGPMAEIGQFLQSVPTDAKVVGSVRASSVRKDTDEDIDTADFKLGLDATGDFGDLAYKINLEAIKKGNDLYFKINNIPSIILGPATDIKGRWITMSSSSEFMAGFLEGMAAGRLQSKEFEDGAKELNQKIAAIADEVQFVTFKHAPEKIVVGGENLVRYEIEFNKKAFAPFQEKMLKEIATQIQPGGLTELDPAGLEYLRSEEFYQNLEYFNKNSHIFIMTNKDGMAVGFEFRLRVVPSDDVVAYKGKQGNLLITMMLSDINQPIQIEAPAGAIPFEETVVGQSLSSARTKGSTAAVKAALSQIRAEAELVYDEVDGYGTAAFALGTCKKTAGTLFGDQLVFTMITSTQKYASATATCVSKTKNGKVESYAISISLPDKSGNSFCIDSTGAAKEIKGKITTDSCK